MTLAGKTVYFLGKLAASNRKEAGDLVRRVGGKMSQKLTPAVHLVVVGEGEVLSQDWNFWNDQLDDATREAFEAGTLEIVSEATFWDRYGNEDENRVANSDRPLYTPAMLAELSRLPIGMVRQLERRGLIIPLRKVHRLCYFDLENVLFLKIVKNMLDAGLSFPKVVDRLHRVRQQLPGASRDAYVDGKEVLFMTDRGPIELNGQRRFPFAPEPDAPKTENILETEKESPLKILDTVFAPKDEEDWSVEKLVETAFILESDNRLEEALQVYRTALAAGGAHPQINFQMAELLYRLGDLSAARERYSMAVELDEEFVEARANLGCVLAELHEDELALAAFRGALKYHPDYAEVHYHLGMLLRRLGREEEAREHFQLFLELSPDSPGKKTIDPETRSASS